MKDPFEKQNKFTTSFIISTFLKNLQTQIILFGTYEVLLFCLNFSEEEVTGRSGFVTYGFMLLVPKIHDKLIANSLGLVLVPVSIL